MKYSTLVKQLFIILKSKWIVYFLRGEMFSLASFEVITNLKKTVPDLNYIIDVGANRGQFSNVASHFYPKAKIQTFEPLPNLFPIIQKKFIHNKNIFLNNIALGNEDGIIKFNQNDYGHISSILDISTDNKHYPKKTNDLKQIIVEIKKLDTFLINEEILRPSLLKLDVQGFELEVLRGALQTLNNIDYLIIEANLEQLYNNQPSFTEMNLHLNSVGFEMSGMLDFNLGSKNKYIEIDLLYKNTMTI